MYRILLNQSGDAGTLAVAQFNLALEDGKTDCFAEADTINALLRAVTWQTPQQREAMLLDTYQAVFWLATKGDPAREAAFSALCARLFDGITLAYPIGVLLEIQHHFTAYRADFKELGEIDALCALATQVGEDTLLCYQVRREVLNLLLLSAKFLERLELTRALTDAVKQCPAAVKTEAQAFEGGLFSDRIVGVQK